MPSRTFALWCSLVYATVAIRTGEHEIMKALGTTENLADEKGSTNHVEVAVDGIAAHMRFQNPPMLASSQAEMPQVKVPGLWRVDVEGDIYSGPNPNRGLRSISKPLKTFKETKKGEELFIVESRVFEETGDVYGRIDSGGKDGGWVFLYSTKPATNIQPVSEIEIWEVVKGGEDVYNVPNPNKGIKAKGPETGKKIQQGQKLYVDKVETHDVDYVYGHILNPPGWVFLFDRRTGDRHGNGYCKVIVEKASLSGKVENLKAAALLETNDKLEVKKTWKSGCSCAGEECDQTSGGCCVHECGSSR